MKHSIINYFQSFSSIRELKLSRRTAIPLYLFLGGLYQYFVFWMLDDVSRITDFSWIIILITLIVVFLLVCRMRDAHLPWYLTLLPLPLFVVSFELAYLISFGLMFLDLRPQNTEHNITHQKDAAPRLLHRLAIFYFLSPLVMVVFVYSMFAIAHLGILMLDCQVSTKGATYVSGCMGAEVWEGMINFSFILVFLPIVALGGVTLGIILKLLAFRDAKHKDYQSSKRDV